MARDARPCSSCSSNGMYAAGIVAQGPRAAGARRVTLLLLLLVVVAALSTSAPGVHAASVCSAVRPVCNPRSHRPSSPGNRGPRDSLPTSRRWSRMAVYSTITAPDDVVPQKVAPRRALLSDLAVSSAASAQRVDRLLATLREPLVNITATPGAINGSATQARHIITFPNDPAASLVTIATANLPPPVNEAPPEEEAIMAASGRAAVPNGMVLLSNRRLRVAVDLVHGGSITHLSSARMPQKWANKNVINTWDAGRLIQQSYYGCSDGTCWHNQPWRWNPVQGGSWQNRLPRVVDSSVRANRVRVRSNPRNWGGQELLDDVVMMTEVTVMNHVIRVRCTMEYHGTAPHPPRHQELPAIFVDRRLGVLATYTGSAPWQNGPLSFYFPGQTGSYYRPTEHWAAYVDEASGYGLGVFTPVATDLVAYRIGPDASNARSDCSYLAPLVTAAVTPGHAFEFAYYIAMGRVDEMRAWFKDLAQSIGRPAPPLRLMQQQQQEQQEQQPSAVGNRPLLLQQLHVQDDDGDNTTNASAFGFTGLAMSGFAGWPLDGVQLG